MLVNTVWMIIIDNDGEMSGSDERFLNECNLQVKCKVHFGKLPTKTVSMDISTMVVWSSC